jgi:ferredoxin
MEGDFKSCVGCILCYNNDVNVYNLKTRKRKGLIKYHKTYGITTLKKHVDVN